VCGETYLVGGDAEMTNLALVELLLDIVDEIRGNETGTSRALIKFVEDRPGHDFRYAMDISAIRYTLGWRPSVTLPDGMRRTVNWYLENQQCVTAVASDDHSQFQTKWYETRDQT
jgi:dTDP-glucose 4,6-dehydratase